jgi:hypothetical protein
MQVYNTSVVIVAIVEQYNKKSADLKKRGSKTKLIILQVDKYYCIVNMLVNNVKWFSNSLFY